MSIVCAAIKNDEIAIAADTQLSFGSLRVNAVDLQNANKLYRVNDSVIGIVGWNAMSELFEHIIEQHPKIFDFSGRKQIFITLLKLHKMMKDDYFLETSEHSSQPVESLQFDGLIVNKHGIFEIGSYREVNQYNRYWAVGSGNRYALGAMHVLYDTNISAEEMVLNGVETAAKFNVSCSLPATSERITIPQEEKVGVSA